MGQTVSLLVSLALTAIAALVQGGLLTSVSVKPNLVLVVVLAVVFFERILWRQLAVLFLAMLIIKAQPGLELMNVVFIGVALLSLLLKNRLPWRHEMNFFAVVLASTLALYLFGATYFLYQNFSVVLLEMLYNGVLSIPVFWLFTLIYGKENRRWKT